MKKTEEKSDWSRFSWGDDDVPSLRVIESKNITPAGTVAPAPKGKR